VVAVAAKNYWSNRWRDVQSLGVSALTDYWLPSGRARSCVHSIPDLSFLLPELNRGSSVPVYPYRPRGRNDCKHNHLRSLPVKARLAHFNCQLKDGVLLPAWYAQPNPKVQLTHWPVCSQNLGL
jgi:hypothetical protein